MAYRGKDEASFDFPVLQRIWGFPRCPLSGTHEVQWHHCEGRGGKHDRKICSSPFNAFPLGEPVHMYAPVNDPDLKRFFRNRAYAKVMEAVGRGAYEITENDREFLSRHPLLD